MDSIRGSIDHSSNGRNAEVDFETLVPGKWTQLAIVCSFTSNEVVDQALGFTWSAAPAFGPNAGDDYLVFATEDSVVAYSRVPRGITFCTNDGRETDGTRIVLRSQSAMTLTKIIDDGVLYGDPVEWWRVDPDSIQVERDSRGEN